MRAGEFKLHVSVTNKQPGEGAEGKPATGAVNQKVIAIMHTACNMRRFLQ